MTLTNNKTINVTRVKEFTDGISFDATVDGIDLYRMTLKVGKYGKFVSFPSYEGKNGTWYKYYYVKFNDNDINEIIKQIQGLLK